MLGGRVHVWVPHAAACISREAMGRPPVLGMGKLRQAQGQQSRPADSAQCPVEGAAPLTCPTSPCSSRTKNMMWYGVLGTKELLQRTYKNLEQRVQLEVWGNSGNRDRLGVGGWRSGPQAQPSLAVRWGAHLAAQPAGHRCPQHPQLRWRHQLLGRHQGGQCECQHCRVGKGGMTSFPCSLGTWEPLAGVWDVPALGTHGGENLAPKMSPVWESHL